MGILSNITDIVAEVPEVISPITDIVIAVVPILILIAVVGFITGLFDRILGAIQGGFRRMKF